jgi:hypothetical protein
VRRGFKAHAEREALAYRDLCQVGVHDRLHARVLASYLGLELVHPQDIPGMTPEVLETLRRDSDSWSAMTLPSPTGGRLIYNPFHAPTRQESDILHEVAHVICGHEPSTIGVLPSSGLPLRGYDTEQEDEARWLGGCLQVPREALIACVATGMTAAAIAVRFGASQALVEWRIRQTGCDRQVQRARIHGPSGGVRR